MALYCSPYMWLTIQNYQQKILHSEIEIFKTSGKNITFFKDSPLRSASLPNAYRLVLLGKQQDTITFYVSYAYSNKLRATVLGIYL